METRLVMMGPISPLRPGTPITPVMRRALERAHGFLEQHFNELPNLAEPIAVIRQECVVVVPIQELFASMRAVGLEAAVRSIEPVAKTVTGNAALVLVERAGAMDAPECRWRHGVVTTPSEQPPGPPLRAHGIGDLLHRSTDASVN